MISFIVNFGLFLAVFGIFLLVKFSKWLSDYLYNLPYREINKWYKNEIDRMTEGLNPNDYDYWQKLFSHPDYGKVSNEFNRRMDEKNKELGRK